MAAKRFSGMHVAQVHFHRRQAYCGQCVGQGYARVRVRGGVNNDAVGCAMGRLDGVNQFALVVRLNDVQLNPVRGGALIEKVVYVSQRCFAVYVYLARTEHV